MEKKSFSNRETFRVFLSEKRVSLQDMHGAVPEGCRYATLMEAVREYRKNRRFRKELMEKGPAFVAQKGLLSSGYYGITAEGGFVRIDAPEAVTERERSYHFSGSGYVIVDFDDPNRGLDVDARADMRFIINASVVCVDERRERTERDASSSSTRVSTEKFDAAREAFRKAESGMESELAAILRDLFGSEKE